MKGCPWVEPPSSCRAEQKAHLSLRLSGTWLGENSPSPPTHTHNAMGKNRRVFTHSCPSLSFPPMVGAVYGDQSGGPALRVGEFKLVTHSPLGRAGCLMCLEIVV